MNRYLELYQNIINERQLDILGKTDELYTEEHHIIPKSFGGTNEKDNLVRLTGEEHYKAHYYLYKSYDKGSDERMVSMGCYMAMCSKSGNHGRDYLIDAKIYQEVREEYYKVLESRGLDKVKEIIQFIHINKRNPTNNLNDDYERILSYKLQDLKRSKDETKECTTIFFDSYQELVEENGLETLFEIKDDEQEAIDKITELCEWIKSNGRYPKRTDKTELGISHSRTIEYYKAVKTGSRVGIWNDKFQDIVESYGYNELFLNKEYIQINNLTKALEWTKNNRFPKYKSSSEEEKLYYGIIKWQLRKKKKETIKKEALKLLEEIESYKEK